MKKKWVLSARNKGEDKRKEEGSSKRRGEKSAVGREIKEVRASANTHFLPWCCL